MLVLSFCWHYHFFSQEVSASVSRLWRDMSGQYSDFHILSSLNSQVRRVFLFRLICCCFSSLNFIACMLKCILFHCWRDLFESCCFSCFNYSVMLNCILFLCWRKLFESSASMNTTAVKSLMSALHQLSSQHISGRSQLSGQQIGSISFSVERMASILINNLHSGFFLYLEHSFR